MALRLNELNIHQLKVGDKVTISNSYEYNDKGVKVAKKAKATVVAIKRRWFMARVDCQHGHSYNICINYISNNYSRR